jgi:serine/threonine protein kinase
MQVECDHCRRLLNFDAERPSFCAFCGQPLLSSGITTPPDPAATTPAAPFLPRDLPAAVGGYRLLRVLGQGGMGTVCEAEDAATGRRVAVKLIAPHFAASGEAVERFRREGRLASAVAHPRCVFVYAADEDAGRPYLVLELMPGDTLRDLVRDRPPPAGTSCPGRNAPGRRARSPTG